MKHALALFALAYLVSCSLPNPEVPRKPVFSLQLHHNNADTVSADTTTGTYLFTLMPVLINNSDDTVTFIRYIYGRINREAPEIFPRLGFNVYQNGKKIPFKEFKGCGNYGYLGQDDFVTVPPGNSMFPFHGSYQLSPVFHYPLGIQMDVKGEVEIEAYYDTSDSTQMKYHPLRDEDMKHSIAQQEYKECRNLFLKVPHVKLNSNRVKFYLK